MDLQRHRRRKTALKVIKIAVGSCIAVGIAQCLGLQYAASAGIITLLTVQDTRKDTIQLTVERFLSFLLSVLLVFLCFHYVGKRGWVNYGVYIFLMVNACYCFGWQNTVSVNAVMGTHYLMTPDYSLSFAVNELVLIMIGTGLALVMNWKMPNSRDVIKSEIQKVENSMQQVLREFALYLEGGLGEEHVWFDLDRLEDHILEGIEHAREHVYNTLSKADQYYVEYMEMRLHQCAILQALRHRMWKMHGMPSQAKTVSHYLEHLADYVHEENIPDRQREELQEVFEQMRQQALPKDREEFESRAILYHVLLDLEDFLFLKQQFADRHIRRQNLKQEIKGWNI